MNGYGALGLVRGISDGINLGSQMIGAYNQMQDYNDRQEVKNVMAQGMDAAKANRQSAIDANMKVGGEASADGSMTVPTYQDAAGKSYGSEAELRGASEKAAPSIEDYYMKNVVPKISETYLRQGNVEQAQKWNDWAEQKNSKAGMKHWAKALQAGQIGDYKAYADNMVKAYNTPGYYDDGLEADGYDLVKDKEGNVTGLTLNLRNKQTGEKFAQTVNGQKDMVQMGIGLLAPENAFKTTQSTVMAAEAAKLKSAEGNLKFQREIMRDDRKAANQAQLQDKRDQAATDRLVTGKQMDAANKKATVDTKAEALRRAGYSEEFINQNMPSLLGLGEFKKAATPAETRRMIHMERMKDFTYSRKPKEEQAAILERDMDIINGGAPQANPMSGGMSPQPQQQRPATGGAPMIYDSKTGQMVPYQR